MADIKSAYEIAMEKINKIESAHAGRAAEMEIYSQGRRTGREIYQRRYQSDGGKWLNTANRKGNMWYRAFLDTYPQHRPAQKRCREEKQQKSDGWAHHGQERQKSA